jgi:hypothetical protein
VTAVFTRQPWMRPPEQVVESLFRVHTKTNNDQVCSSQAREQARLGQSGKG